MNGCGLCLKEYGRVVTARHVHDDTFRMMVERAEMGASVDELAALHQQGWKPQPRNADGATVVAAARTTTT